jgi:hypothetical protein
MTTHDPATIQDASRNLWHLAGSDLLLLADSSGKVMALQATPQEVTVREGQDFFPPFLQSSASREGARHWWYVEGHLYEVFLQDIYFGPASEHQRLGYLLLGYEIDDHVVRDLSRVAASEVAFRYGDVIVRSTLKPAQESELLRVPPRTATPDRRKGIRYRLGEERFLATSVDLYMPGAAALNLWVLKSFDQATAFLSLLNQLLLALGLTALL